MAPRLSTRGVAKHAPVPARRARTLGRALGLGADGCWAFVGAGGKTAAIRRLLHERPGSLASTTTSLDRSGFDCGTLAVAADAAALGRLAVRLAHVRPLTLAIDAATHLGAPAAAQLAAWIAANPSVTLVEADDAGRRLVKLPVPGAPAWPVAGLVHTVVVVGCDALDRPLAEVASRPRSWHGARPGARVRAVHLEQMVRAYAAVCPPRGALVLLLTGIDAGRLELATRLGRAFRRALRAHHGSQDAKRPFRLVAARHLGAGTFWVWPSVRTRAAPASRRRRSTGAALSVRSPFG